MIVGDVIKFEDKTHRYSSNIYLVIETPSIPNNKEIIAWRILIFRPLEFAFGKLRYGLERKQMIKNKQLTTLLKINKIKNNL